MRKEFLRFFLGFASLMLAIPSQVFAAPACSASSITINRISSPIVYIETGTSLTGHYAGYEIVNSSGSDIDDLWVFADDFSGSTISLGSDEDGVTHYGTLADGETAYVYFYLEANAVIGTGQTHDIFLYPGNPLTASPDCEETFSLTSSSTIKANSNKVKTVFATPDPPELGGVAIMTVTGETGTIGGAGIFAYTPATLSTWPAATLELENVTMTMTGGNNRTDEQVLFLSGLSSGNTEYFVSYQFRIKSTTLTEIEVFPVNYINSGSQIKHTDTDSYSITLGSIVPVSNQTYIQSVTPSPSSMTTGGTVEYTVNFQNDGLFDVILDTIQFTLPSSPDTVTFDTSTATFGGVAISDPSISGSVLTFSGQFSIGQRSFAELVFETTAPSTLGTYQASVIGLVGTTPATEVQIDLTIDTSDDEPATGNFIIGTTVATIGDYIWNDVDADGVQDASESGVESVTLDLYVDDGDLSFEPGGDDGAPIASDSTDVNGAYDFVVSGAGSYWVDVTDLGGQLTGSTKTGGNSEPELITVADNQDYNNADYGYDLAPIITVTKFSTSDTTPALYGTVDDPTATISILVNGNTYAATNNGDGTWTLADNTISPALTTGNTYEIVATATDTNANSASDNTTNELRINTSAPSTPTVDFLTTNDTTPTLTGTFDNINSDSFFVAVNGIAYALGFDPELTSVGSVWTLNLDGTTPLVDATYNVQLASSDVNGNTSNDVTTNELIVDTTAPVITVNTLNTTDTTPALTGTVDDTTATISITVDGNPYVATNNGDGTWTLADNSITPALSVATYDVSATATDTAGNSGSDATTNELTITTAVGTPTVDSLTTNDTTPTLTGTWDEVVATILTVEVDGTTYTLGTDSELTSDGSGNWTLDLDGTTALTEGTYDVTVTNSTGPSNTASDATTDELVIDLTPPTVTVDSLTTGDSTPALTGTVNDTTATISVTVNGNTYAATNNGDGTWTLADNTISPALGDGTYDVSVTATDSVGNDGTDATTDELEVNITAPTVTVDLLTTNDTTPALSGTVNDTTATISVTVNGNTYPATNNGDGTWTLADDTISPALADGTYDVSVTATDTVGNDGTDATTDELVVDLTPPTVTVDSLSTSDTTPELTGTVDDTTATISVTVNGNTYPATNNGDGTWTLADNTISPALSLGTYDVSVTATDSVGNDGTDATTDELDIVVASLDAPTVNSLTTNDRTPTLTGTWDEADATTLTVTVDGTTYTLGVDTELTTNGSGDWTLNLDGTSDLSDGTYDVVATNTDGGVLTESDSTTDELVVDATAPTVTINTLNTSDTTPALSGTIDDPTATISVTVNGNTYPATNNGDGTWTLADNTISPALGEGTYDVSVTATDGVGNIGNDATTDELVIDTTTPTVTIDELTTNDTTPELTGTINDPTATVSVTVDGITYPETNNGDGTWTLADNTISPPLTEGTYDVSVTATDGAGNSGSDATTNELAVKFGIVSPVYFPWNGFIDQANVASLTNRGASVARIDLFLYDIEGNLQHQKRVRIDPFTIAEIIINDLPGYVEDSYGFVKLEYPDTVDFDGHMAFYKQTPNSDEMEFTILVPFTNSLVGNVYMPFNTTQPSNKAGEENYAVYNWIQIVNAHQTATRRFTVNLYDEDGDFITSSRVKVPANGRRDVTAGHITPGVGFKGLVEVVPDTAGSPYVAQMFYYSALAPIESLATVFNFAQGVSMIPGNNDTAYALITRAQGGDNEVVITNAEDTSANVTATFIKNTGTIADTQNLVIPARGQVTVSATSRLNANKSGVIKIEPTNGKKLITRSIVYYRKTNGSMSDAAGITAREPSPGIKFNAFNTFLNQDNYVRAFNTAGVQSTMDITTTNVNGNALGAGDVLLNAGTGVDLELVDDFGFPIPSSMQGLIQMEESVNESIYGEVFRIKMSGDGSYVDIGQALPLR